MAKSEKELNTGMMDVLKKVKGVADKGAEMVARGISKLGSTVDRSAEAAVKEKTVQQKKEMLGDGAARQTANILTNKDKQIKQIFGE